MRTARPVPATRSGRVVPPLTHDTETRDAMSTLTTTIKSLSRMTASESGNPRWNIETTDGHYLTKPDAQVNYLMEGIDPVNTGESPRVELRLNDDCQVIGVEEVA